MKKNNLKFNKNSIIGLFKIVVRYRVLILLSFFLLILFFSFQVIYKDAYVKINYIDYIESEDRVIANLKSANRLCLSIVEQNKIKKDNFLNSREYKYRNPFMYEVMKQKSTIETIGEDTKTQLKGKVTDNDFVTIDQS